MTFFIMCFHISIVIYTHLYARAPFSFFYTLIRSLSEDPGFAHPHIACFILLFRSWLRSYTLQLPRVSLYLVLVFLSSFIPVVILLILYIYQTLLLFQFLIYMISCVDIYICYCS